MAEDFERSETPAGGEAPPAAGVPPLPDGPDKDARMWGMIAHLSSFIGLLGIPLANIIAPLVVWLIKKEEMPFVDDQGKEAINFQITMTIAALVLALLTCFVAGLGALIVVVFDVIMVIIAAIKANEGVRYRYPLTLRLIK